MRREQCRHDSCVFYHDVYLSSEMQQRFSRQLFVCVRSCAVHDCRVGIFWQRLRRCQAAADPLERCVACLSRGLCW